MFEIHLKRRSSPGQTERLAVLVFIVFLGLTSPFLDFAVESGSGTVAAYDFSKSLDNSAGRVGLKTGEEATELPQLIGLILFAGLSLIGVVFLILVIVAGIRWMISQGNEQEIEKAKNTLWNGAIGILVVMASYAITYFVINVLF